MVNRIKIILICLALAAGALSLFGAAAALASDATGGPVPAGTTPNPAKTYYFTWYDSKAVNGMNGDWIIIGNLEDKTATAQVYFGTETAPRGTYDIAPHDRQVVSWPDTIGGPVRVVSPNGDTLVVTQRVLYHDSFNEVAAVEDDQSGATLGGNLDTTYYFTWYDSKPENGMKGNWILVTNMDDQVADVDIYIGTTRMGTYHIDPGDRITPQYPDTIGGPVKVVSTNGQRLVASQRVLCNEGFNEVPGMPAGQLDTTYFFTWYDMIRATGMKGNWVLISNINDTPVHAEVYIGTGSTPKGTYTVGPHESVTPTYPELMDGPVRVRCTDCAPGQNILVSQRVLFRDSFEEIQGTPTAGLSDDLFFGWYDFTAANHMKGNWVLVANMGAGAATVDVYLGTSTTPIGTYSIGEGDRVTPQFPEVIGGPIHVTSRGHQPLMVSQRVVYIDSFNELLGQTKQSVGFPITESPQMTLFKMGTYWASYDEYLSGQLSVDFRISDTGLGTAVGAAVTSVTATNGVTATTAMPIPLGDIASGGHTDFTVKYQIPAGVNGFNTTVHAQCQDTDGNWFYYPE